MIRSFSESENCFGCDGEEEHFCRVSNPLSQSPYRELSHSKYFVRKNTGLPSYKMYAQGNNSGAFVLFLNLHSVKFLFRHGKIVLNVKCIDFFSLILFPPISILIFQLGKRVEEKHVGFYVIFRCSLSAQTGFGICQKKFIQLQKRKI